jgi:phosphatidylserine/phosphatidylglycerophosphate/cardiolipin synthase-like enzyme
MAMKKVPWDANCRVTPLIGGFETMESMRVCLESAIREATASPAPAGERGHVYVAGWRLDPLRDLSSQNAWRTGRWTANQTAAVDETAIGLFFRLLEAGVTLRILMWLPHWLQSRSAMTKTIVQEHSYLFSLIQRKSADLEANGFPPGLGVVALDTRVGAFAGSHHQKLIVVRGAAATHVAYCGGVDLAFTRRDAPAQSPAAGPAFNGGDWQSGAWLPGGAAPAFTSRRWPTQRDVVYPAISPRAVADDRVIKPDLPDSAYGSTNQIWHDQHLRLEGDIVLTLERQFGERWVDPAPARYACVRGNRPGSFFRSNAVYVSHARVVDAARTSGALEPLPLPAALPRDANTGTSLVQMWRTIPVRRRGKDSHLFERGEFSNLAGIARACTRARELIWIFDQYFWSRPLSRLLNEALADAARPGLRVIVILPPYPDGYAASILTARRRSFADVSSGLTRDQLARIRVYNLWHPIQARGIYAHAKAQTYDGSLLVCGSCNLNQRSFLCDTELDCAVLDPAVVREHQSRLWRLLFPAASGIEEQLGSPSDLNRPGSGARFFEAFRSAATPRSFVVEDPDFCALDLPPREPAVPNGWPARPPDAFDPLHPGVPGFVLDPSSLSANFPPAADLLEIATYLVEDSASNPAYRR